MLISREELAEVKDDLRRFVEAETDFPDISAQGRQAVERLAQLGAGDLAVLGLEGEDAELAKIALAAKSKIDEILEKQREGPTDSGAPAAITPTRSRGLKPVASF